MLCGRWINSFGYIGTQPLCARKCDNVRGWRCKNFLCQSIIYHEKLYVWSRLVCLSVFERVPNMRDGPCTSPRKTPSRKDISPQNTWPNGHYPECTFSWTYICQNVHLVEWTFPRKPIFQNGHLPECTFGRMDISPKTYFPEWTLAKVYIWC